MDMYKYLQYAAVTSPIVLAIIFLSLTFKAWLDRSTAAWSVKLSKQAFSDYVGDNDHDDFDAHVESAPGMQFGENLN